MFIQPKGTLNFTKSYGVVIKESDNYVLIFTFSGYYYLPCKNNNFQIFDLLYVTGSSSKLSFSHFEQGFDFTNYLNLMNVNYQIEAEDILIKFKLLPRKTFYLSTLKYISGDNYLYLKSILFSDSISKDFSLYYQIMDADLFTFVCVSSMGVYFLLGVIENILDRMHCHEKVKIIIKIFILFFICFFNKFKFSLLRILILNCYYSFNKLKTSNNQKYKRNNLVNNKEENDLHQSKMNSLELNSIIFIFFILINPFNLFSKSFYYSFALVFFNNLIIKMLYKFQDYKRNILRMIFISFFIMPFSLLETYQLNVNKLILNVFLLYLANVIYTLSTILYLVPIFGIILNYIITAYIYFLKFICQYSISINLGQISVLLICLYYLALLMLIFGLTYFNKKVILTSLSFFPLIISFNHVNYLIPKYEVHFIDVDQGDCALIRYKYNNFLIDTGGSLYTDLARECLIPYFKKNKINKIDAVFISHRDFDHYGSLSSLENNFNVEKVIYPENFTEIEIGGLLFTNLNVNADFSDSNNSSSVISFKINSKKFLFTGDIDSSVEKRLIEENKDLNADILKVSHHGSKYSTSNEFLDAVNPDVAVISVGEKNYYKHPSNETLDRLKNKNIKIMRTDLENTIIIKA